jgi:hypothetical protein
VLGLNVKLYALIYAGLHGNRTDGAEGDYPAVEIASTVKMIQNSIIGPITIAVTIYWIEFVETAIQIRLS